MIDVTLRKEEHWEGSYEGYNWTYVPGKFPPPVKERWEICDKDSVYEITGYASGVQYDVVTDTKPEVEGSFFTFILKSNKYYIPEHLMDAFKVTRLTRRTYHRLVKGENDKCPRWFPNDKDGEGKCVVEYRRVLAIDDKE